MKIGCHLSSGGGYLAMGQTAASIDANVFQFFTRNPRGGAAKPIDKADVAAFLGYAAENGIGPILAHAPYTLNAASSDPRIRDFAQGVFIDDLTRLELTPGAMYNFHPGSHVGQGAEKGIELISELLLHVFDAVRKVAKGKIATTVLLETMSGKGSEVGRTFEELRAIIDRTALPLGVCLDTCHVWDGGYDIVGALEEVLDEFDRTVGLGRLRALHLNDSKNPCGSHKDRHEKLGEGTIGLQAFAQIVRHPLLRGLPMVLETPNDLEGYAREISLLRTLAGG